MPRIIFNLKVFFAAIMLTAFISCGNGKQDQKQANQAVASVNQQISRIQMFINYIDAIAKLPLANFDQSHILALNQAAPAPLQLVVFAEGQADEANSIIMQPYRNNDAANPVKAGAIFLLPKSLSDSARVADFTRHFGEPKKEDGAIAVTEQPLPVHLRIDEGTVLKLTFNNSEKLSLANVIAVEVLKYK